MGKPLNVSVLRITNYKAVHEEVVTVTPGARRVALRGPNGHGKTTVLEALRDGVFGIDPSKVRPGADTAEIVIEIDGDDSLEIRRERNGAGQTLEVRRNGKTVPRAKEFLAGVLGISSFNPLDLLDPKRLKDEIMGLLGVTVTAEDVAKRLGVEPEQLPGNVDWEGSAVDAIAKARAWYAAQRTEAGRTLKAKAAVLDDARCNLPPERPAPTFSGEDLRGLEHEAGDILATERGKAGTVEATKKRITQLDSDERATLNKIREFEDELARRKAALKSLLDERTTLAKRLEETGPDAAKIAEAEAALAQVAEKRMALREHEAAQAQREACRIIGEEHAIAEARHGELDARVEKLGPALVSELIAASDDAVPGLTWDGTCFRLGDAPVDQLSDGEKIRLAVQLARRKGAGLKLLCVDGIEKLDSANMDALEEEVADDPDMILWTTEKADEVETIGAEVVRA